MINGNTVLGFDKLTQYRVCLLEDGRQLALVTSTSAFEAECSLLRERGYDYYTLEVVYARPVGSVSFWHPALPEIGVTKYGTTEGPPWYACATDPQRMKTYAHTAQKGVQLITDLGSPADWSRGATRDEAVGGLVRRLAVEHEGANWRRERASKAPRIQLSIVDLGGITSPQAYRLLGEVAVGAAHRREIRAIQKQAKAAGCECSWSYCRSLYTFVRFVEAP